MIKMIFVTKYSSESEDAATALGELTLSDATHLRSATQEDVTFTQGQLVGKVKASLADIRATYLRAMSGREKLAIHSR